MTDGYRQEVLNVMLARLLQERGVISAPESIFKLGIEERRRIPDVIVDFNGLRTAIEGEVSDRADAPQHALAAARARVVEGIAHIGVAVVYPARLRESEFSQLESELAASELEMAVVTESGETGFVKGNVDALENALGNAFEQLVREDVVAQAVAILDAAVKTFAFGAANLPGVVGRMADTLSIHELPRRIAAAEEESE